MESKIINKFLAEINGVKFNDENAAKRQRRRIFLALDALCAADVPHTKRA